MGAVGPATAGTLLGALRYGLPLVCWPQSADQFHNARVCALAGASLTVKDATGAAHGLRSVLDGKSYRSAAQRLQLEIMAQGRSCAASSWRNETVGSVDASQPLCLVPIVTTSAGHHHLSRYDVGFGPGANT